MRALNCCAERRQASTSVELLCKKVVVTAEGGGIGLQREVEGFLEAGLLHRGSREIFIEMAALRDQEGAAGCGRLQKE